MAANGNALDTISFMTVGKTSGDGYVTGRVSPNRSPVARQYAARLSGSTRSPRSSYTVDGAVVDFDPRNGRAPSAAEV